MNQLRSLKEKSTLQQFVDHAQDDEDVSGLLEDIREAISDYQVCFIIIQILLGVDKDSR